MVTSAERRGRGYATAIVQALLSQAVAAGARYAYLQVDAANAPARHIYERFGFRDRYAYWYRAAPASEGKTS
jgi:predicted GNAT family acetyltransferase